jgi:glycosyltransferase involved in cell wall biosynthesis
VPSRFPTEKAYGVTIGESAKAALGMGVHAEIWCSTPADFDHIDSNVKSIQESMNVSTNKIFEMIIFQLSRAKFIFRSIKLMPQRDVCIWTRDVLAALLILRFRPNLRIALELHHPLGMTDKVFLKLNSHLLKRTQSNLSVFTLTEILKKRLPNNLRAFFKSTIHMAAPGDFFESMKPKNSNGKIVLGYVGKAFSSGEDNQIDLVLKLLIKEIELFPNLYLRIIGIERNKIDQLISMVPKHLLEIRRVSIVGHVSRMEILENLREIDIGLVPYISNEYNDYRFPIKMVEYASLGCVLLVSDTKSFRNLVGENGIFVDLKSTDSLHLNLSALIHDADKLNRYGKLAYLWAKRFTYEERVKIVLNSF